MSAPRINPPRLIIPRFHTERDQAVEAEALRARSLARQQGRHWNAYAWCDRAPLGWESRTQHNEQEG
jgi:hypothetical protein